MIGKEDVKLSKKQMDELIELIDKEEFLEVEEQIQKALKKVETEGEEPKRATEITLKEDKSEDIVDDSSKTESVESSSTARTTGAKKTNEELKGDSKGAISNPEDRNKPQQSTPVIKSSSTDVVRDPTVTTVTSSVPPPPKKAEGSKQL